MVVSGLKQCFEEVLSCCCPVTMCGTDYCPGCVDLHRMEMALNFGQDVECEMH